MTPAQCRAARGFLYWTQETLAENANVSVTSIRNFEREASAMMKHNVAAVQRALEQGGIEFIPGGIRLKGV